VLSVVNVSVTRTYGPFGSEYWNGRANIGFCCASTPGRRNTSRAVVSPRSLAHRIAALLS
jgi:hypothetical protein